MSPLHDALTQYLAARRTLGTQLKWPESSLRRSGEALALNIADVDLVVGILAVRNSKLGCGELLLRRCAGLNHARLRFLIETGRTGAQSRVVRQRDVCRAWARAGVKPEVWTKRPDHAFRKGIVSGLKRLLADIDAIEVLVGHKLPGQRSVYTDPDSVPMREAVALIPAIGAPAVAEPIRLDRLRSSNR